MLKKYLFLPIISIILLPTMAFATVIGGQITGGNVSGSFIKLDPPPAQVGLDSQNRGNLYAFDEKQNISLVNIVNVDVGFSPLPGYVVASHYIFFDPRLAKNVEGYVDFDADIYGIITSTGLLTASDFLKNDSVNYLGSTLRGLEPRDQAWIDSTYANRLRVKLRARSPGDYIRVLTMRSSIPEPSMIGLMGLGFMGLLLYRRKRA